MCDLKPGDEVVCVNARADARYGHAAPMFLKEGQHYIVDGIWCPYDTPYLFLAGIDEGSPPELRADFNPARFRKVQKRDLTAWLATGNTIEEPRRVRDRERV